MHANHLQLLFIAGHGMSFELLFVNLLYLIVNSDQCVNRIFSEFFLYTDMDRTLCELGFASREALIVVPHRQPTRPSRGQSSSPISNDLLNVTNTEDSSGGYFSYVKSILSYFNPLSYFRGNSGSPNSEPGANDGSWQYRKC